MRTVLKFVIAFTALAISPVMAADKFPATGGDIKITPTICFRAIPSTPMRG